MAEQYEKETVHHETFNLRLSPTVNEDPPLVKTNEVTLSEVIGSDLQVPELFG